VGAGQYSSVSYIQNVEASASNHFAQPRKVNKKIEIALNNIKRKKTKQIKPNKEERKDCHHCKN